MNGWSHETLGPPLDIIVPERWRERHAAGYRQAMAIGAAAVIHDVTERWERHKRVRERLVQLEAGERRG
jgi:hypothetical protein